MNYLEQMLPEIRKLIESGYYVHKERERKSVLEAIEKAHDEGRVPLIGELKGFLPKQGAVPCGHESRAFALDRVTNRGALAVANAYVESGVCGLSIATAPLHLGGSLAFLNKRWKVPVIMEDFVIDERQIGSGDAVVLIMPLLEAAGADENELIDIAHEKEMETVLEVHSAGELKRAKKTESDIICINNRDWKTMNVDAGHTAILLAEERCDRTVLSGGGIETREQVEAVLKAGADGVIVGTCLMKAEDVKKKTAELLSVRKAAK